MTKLPMGDGVVHQLSITRQHLQSHRMSMAVAAAEALGILRRKTCELIAENIHLHEKVVKSARKRETHLDGKLSQLHMDMPANTAAPQAAHQESSQEATHRFCLF